MDAQNTPVDYSFAVAENFQALVSSRLENTLIGSF